jgi:hypothetical protein
MGKTAGPGYFEEEKNQIERFAGSGYFKNFKELLALMKDPAMVSLIFGFSQKIENQGYIYIN